MPGTKYWHNEEEKAESTLKSSPSPQETPEVLHVLLSFKPIKGLTAKVTDKGGRKMGKSVE